MNPFENIYEEQWDKTSVETVYKKYVISKKFKCIEPINPYQHINFTETKTVPITIIASLNHKKHLHNSTLGRNPLFNSYIHELYQTVTLVHNSSNKKTLVQWSITSTYIIDENILDFPLSKTYNLEHKDVISFLYDFDRISYNVKMFLRAIKEIYHKPSFDVIQ